MRAPPLVASTLPNSPYVDFALLPREQRCHRFGVRSWRLVARDGAATHRRETAAGAGHTNDRRDEFVVIGRR
jgi:hypothetical protein